MSKRLSAISVSRDDDTVLIMNLNYSEHDEIIFRTDELIVLTQALSNELGINDLLKLRDHVEQKIKEIYSVKEG